MDSKAKVCRQSLEKAVVFLNSSQGEQSIRKALEQAEKLNEELRKARKIPISRLNEPMTV